MTAPAAKLTLAAINAATHADFVATLGDLFEHSPWVAERVAGRRPFSAARDLFTAMTAQVRAASEGEQMALIKAHPELAGREAVDGTLTADSTSEQGRLGINRLGADEFERLGDLNARYTKQFGFPCIIALRLHPSRDSVFAAFEKRLGNPRSAEIETALAQIDQIARGRLAARMGRGHGRLSTHVLDTADGIPAAALKLTLEAEANGAWRTIRTTATNANGRTDEPLLSDIEMEPGRYLITFEIGDYFRARGTKTPEPPFLDHVPLQFGLADPDGHYHVPLLCSPWSYSTYRGS